jgi:diamine N-acetyltransferase
MVSVRRAVPADAAKLSLVGGASFLESFADDHPGDDLVNHVLERHSVMEYEAWLNDPTYALWILEEALGAPVGYAMLGPAELPGTKPDDFEIKRIYVLRRWHGGGHGKKLFSLCCDEAKQRGGQRLILSVYTKNDLAREFYSRQGMAIIGKAEFKVGKARFIDLVMALDL